jgi:hypothetical protein
MDEIAEDARFQQRVLHEAAERARREPGGHALAAQLTQHARNVDPFAARVDPALAHAIRIAGGESLQHERLVDGRVQRDGNDHESSGMITP